MPELRAAPAWEETGVAEARGVTYATWYALPRAERAACIARARLQARLDYWLHEWHQGRGLPAPQMSRG